MSLKCICSLALFVSLVISCRNVVDSCKCDPIPEGTNRDPHIFGITQKIKSDTLLTTDGNRPQRPRCELDYSDEVRRAIIDYNVAWFNQLIPEVGILADTVMTYFWGDKKDPGIAACFDKVTQYVKDAFQQKFENDAVDKIKGFKDIIAYLLDSEHQYCTADSQNHTTCNSDYISRMLAAYDQSVMNGPMILRPLSGKLWTSYFLREFCTIQLTIALRLAAVTNTTDRAINKEFAGKIVNNSRWCLDKTGSVIDEGLQNLKGDQIKLAPMYRAMAWRDMKSWFDGLAGMASYETMTSGNTLELGKGRKVMLRKTSADKFPDQWFECGRQDKCTWSSCPGAGPQYNSSDDPTPYTNCPHHVLRIAPIEEPNKAGGKDILVGSKVKLLALNGQRVSWEIRERKIGKAGANDCYAWFLDFVLVKDSKPSPRNSVFKLESWDWGGRRRREGEAIADRDWVVFMYSDGTPDYKKLSKEPAMHYIEGFVFLLPDGA